MAHPGIKAALIVTSACFVVDICFGVIFVDVPGLHKVHEGESVALVWTTDVPIDIDEKSISAGTKLIVRDSVDSVNWGNGYENRSEYLQGRNSLGVNISALSMSDGATYGCEIDRRYSNSEATVYVYGTPDTPIITPAEADATYMGDNISITCRAVSTSLPVDQRPHVDMFYTWRHNDQELTSSDRYRIQSDTGELVILGATEEDTGNYTCFAHEEGSRLTSNDSRPFQLEVLYGPHTVQIHPGEGYVSCKQNDDLVLTCTASCNPVCNFTWNYGTPIGPVISVTSNLLLTKVQRDQAGLYYCLAYNGVGSGEGANTTLVVYYGPDLLSFTSHPRNGSIIESDSTTLACDIESKPPANISLIGPDGTVLHALHSSAGIEYTIHNITCMESGLYRCDARNERTLQSVRIDSNIQVLCPPSVHDVIPGSRRMQASPSETVLFTVNIIAFPYPVFSWGFLGNHSTELTLPENALVLNNDRVSMLNISRVTEGNYGVYLFNARNTYGQVEALHITLQPPTDQSSTGLSGGGLAGVILGVMTSTVLLTLGCVVAIYKYKITNNSSQSEGTSKTDTGIAEGTETYESPGPVYVQPQPYTGIGAVDLVVEYPVYEDA